MINLLPPKYKSNLKQEENWKVIMILGILFLSILISFSLILYAMNIFLDGEINFQKIIYEQKERELENPKMRSLQENLTAFNRTFSRLDAFYQGRLRMAAILESISTVIPPEISLTNLVFKPDPEDKKNIECLLAGFSPYRETLLSFRDQLEKSDHFSHINFPAASWVKPTDINFTVNFTINLTGQ